MDLATALAVIGSLLLPQVVVADVLVLAGSPESVEARFPPGEFVEGRQLRLAAGEWVQVMADGKVRRLTGPGAWTFSAGQPVERTALEPVAAALKRTMSLGAVRGVIIRQSVPADVWAIDTSRDDTVCIEDAPHAVLWRPVSVGALRASIEDASNGEHGDFDWPAGKQTVAWPTDLIALKSGEYRIASGPHLRRIRMVMLGSTSNDLDLWRALAQGGCDTQLERLSATPPQPESAR
jgi:hypothetical protein